jgi:FixJ family two-component response regulator
MQNKTDCRQPLVVIVDDDSDVLEAISDKLLGANISHKIFQDPMEAMNYIGKHQVGGVYTDFHMKGFGMSGKWIKEKCNERNVACSIISADDKVADILKLDFMRNCIALIKAS